MLQNRQSDVDICLTDFGVAKRAGKQGLKTFCGTDLYLAPEVLQRRHSVNGLGHYGKSVDMWSAGVILFILLSGGPPFDVDGGGMDTVLHNAEVSFPDPLWSSISADAKDLVQKMLVADPEKRVTVGEACDHPWFLTNDGDTHLHPLEDPMLQSRTRKRLFTNTSPTISEGTNKKSKSQEQFDMKPPPAKKQADVDNVDDAKKIERVETAKASNTKSNDDKDKNLKESIVEQSEGNKVQGGPGGTNEVAIDQGSSKSNVATSKDKQDPRTQEKSRQLAPQMNNTSKVGSKADKERVTFQMAQTLSKSKKIEVDAMAKPSEFPLPPNQMSQRFRESVEKNLKSKKPPTDKATKPTLQDDKNDNSTHETPRQSNSSEMETPQSRKVTPAASAMASAAASEEVVDEIIQFSDDENDSIHSYGASSNGDSNPAKSTSAAEPSGNGAGRSLKQSTLSPFTKIDPKFAANRKRKGGPNEVATTDRDTTAKAADKTSKTTTTLKQATLIPTSTSDKKESTKPTSSSAEPAAKRQKKSTDEKATTATSSKTQKKSTDNKEAGGGGKQMTLSSWFTKPMKKKK